MHGNDREEQCAHSVSLPMLTCKRYITVVVAIMWVGRHQHKTITMMSTHCTRKSTRHVAKAAANTFIDCISAPLGRCVSDALGVPDTEEDGLTVLVALPLGVLVTTAVRLAVRLDVCVGVPVSELLVLGV